MVGIFALINAITILAWFDPHLDVDARVWFFVNAEPLCLVL